MKLIVPLLLAGLLAAHAQETYFVNLTGSQEVPALPTAATGNGSLTLNADHTLTYTIPYQNLAGSFTASHIHGAAGPGTNAGVVFSLNNIAASTTAGVLSGTTAALSDAQVVSLRAGLLYANIHTAVYPGGEIRGQIGPQSLITYQGRLADNGSIANGTYDLRFALYDSLTGGNQIGRILTNPAVVVSGGLFTVALDFVTPGFTGTRWLEVGVHTNGGGTFTTLSPRQLLTATPYAVTAGMLLGSLPAGQISGLLPSAQLTGTYSNAVTLNNVGNAFAGNGSGLSSLNASNLTSGTVADARLSTNVALLNSTSQTFTGTNIFDRGLGGPCRLIVSGSGAVDTNTFTGLGFQYSAGPGEGAIMSSYSDGFGYLSFYTKQGAGQPIRKQMIIDNYGGVAIDQQGVNNGALNNGSTNGVGLTFGISSGEGIASKRTAGGNQYGLDFYTGYSNRVSILNSGTLAFSDASESILFPATATNNSPMIEMFSSGTQNADRMVIAHSPSFQNWGLQYQDVGDRFNFLASGLPVLTADLGNQRVGIGITNPAAKLHVVGDTTISGVTQIGSGTGNAETPDKGLIIRRAKSTVTDVGSVVARTDFLTLQRDGSTGGFRIVNQANPGNTTIAFSGITSAGATVNFVTSFGGNSAAATNTVFSDAQNIVYLHGTFGNSFDVANMTEVSLTRSPGDYFWTGTITSTYNQ